MHDKDHGNRWTGMDTIPETQSPLDQLKAQFLSNISHEMRTPLNGIIGSVKLLLMMNQDTDQEELLDGIQLSARRMMHLVENVLLHTELEAGRIESQAERILPGRLLMDILDDFNDERKSPEVVLLVETDASIPDWLVADKENLIRVMTQLVDNALKHTRHGSVTLQAVMTEEKPPASVDWANRMLSVSVVDTGIGIEPEVLSSLFASFALADDSYTRRFQGAGLGLVLCRKLAERMGGRLEVQSVPGKGSTFRVLLPVRVEEIVPGSNRELASLPILVVEDDETSRTLMGLFCELVGLEPVLAESGGTGWEWFQRTAFRLILMDIQMPGLSGLDVLTRIREHEKRTGGHVRIIAVTAYAMPEDKVRFIAAGFDDIMEKPVDLNRFRNMLEKWEIL